MHNDSKLGLLAGVGGVVVAAILFSRQQSGTPIPIAPPITAAATPVVAAPLAQAPVASTPVAARGRPEIAGTTTSRSPSDDE